MTINETLNFIIKGHKEGLLITLSDGDWSTLMASLFDHIDERKAFFNGAKVVLDVGNRQLGVSDISAARDHLSDSNISLWALISTDAKTTASAKDLGLETKTASKAAEPKIQPFDTLINGEMAIFVKRTLRSGYRVVHEGHVIVMGDVNPGAEIIAGGSIIIWGRLSGVVHAGAEGDENAVICALDMSPTQLRIASYLTIPAARKGKPQPKIIMIKNNQPVIENWN